MTGQGGMGDHIRRQQGSWCRSSRAPIQKKMERGHGFSLVELLMVAGLTAVVLAGLGALALVSDVKVGRHFSSIQEAQEEWGRAVIFMKNEVAEASSLSSDLASTVYPCTGEVPDPVLVLKGPPLKNPLDPTNPTAPAWTVFYGVRNRASAEVGLYRGPKLLVRCGPQPLAADRNPSDLELAAIYGHLDEKDSPKQTVLLDRLPSGTPLQLSLLADPTKGPVYDAVLTITMQADTDTTVGEDRPFRVHAQRSP